MPLAARIVGIPDLKVERVDLELSHTEDDVYIAVYLNDKETYITALSGRTSGARPSASARGFLYIVDGDQASVRLRAGRRRPPIVRTADLKAENIENEIETDLADS